MPEWAREYFERGYAQRWRLLAPTDDVRQQAASLRTWLAVPTGGRVLDIGCGHGGYAIALAESGADVIGLDFSTALLSRARHLSIELRTPVRWVRGDMRRLPFSPQCLSAAVLLDAFGFFDTDDEHDAVLREAARTLTIGGRLAMKIVNGAIVIDDFREQEHEERDGVIVAVTNSLLFEPPRLLQRVTVTGSRGSGEYERRQRLYRDGELRAMLERVGLEVTGVFGDAAGAQFDAATSPAIWLVAERRR